MPLLGSILQTTHVLAGSPVSLYKSYAGNLSYVLAGASFRNSESNACSLNNTATGLLSNLPLTAEIVAAYVYWAGSYDADFDNPDDTVTFQGFTLFDGSMETNSFPYNGTTYDFYNGKADVTSIVELQRNTNYTMSNMDIETNPHCNVSVVLGGWALVVIYEDDSEPTRVVNLYDGFQQFRGNAFNIIANNFEISSTPSGKHSHITWEGDVGNSATLGGFSEALTISTQSGTRELTDSTNPSGEQFNSRSNIYGSNNPTYGLDVDEYDIGSYLTPGETFFTTQYSSGGDLVLLTAEVTSVSNIAVADLSVTASNPTSWLEGSMVSKKFTVTNNGPNDVPINSVEFNTTLPAELTFSGTQGDSDWSCTQAGQNLSCIYKPKLRAGWSDYLDITFDVANVAGTDITVLASVNHNNAPYEIFDNQVANDIYQFTTPVENIAVVDLSASSKTYTDVSGDLLLAEDTLRYTITIDDASDLSANGITVTDDLPANIVITPNAYTIISSPVAETFVPGGGTNGTGLLTFIGINLAAGATEQIIYEVKVDASAQEGDSLRNIAEISYNSSTWNVDTGDITVTVIKPDLTPSAIEAIDKNGGFLESGDIITVQVTLDDLYDSDISTLQATLNIPSFIDSFNVINAHTGTDNSSSFIDIQNISFSGSETPILEFEFVMDPATIDGTDFDFSVDLAIGSDLWTLVTQTLTVLNPPPAASGNKPLYLSDNSLSRTPPSSDTIKSFLHGQTLNWVIDNNLQADLELTAGDMGFDFVITGYRSGGVTTRFVFDLIYNDNVGGGDITIASTTTAYGNYRQNTQYPLEFNLNLTSDTTIPSGSSIKLNIYNQSNNNNANQFSQVDVHSINPDPSDNTYSSISLNASTVINVDSITVWDATYGDPTGSGEGNLLTASQPDSDLFIRAVISDPFGAFDITAAEIDITKADGTAYDFSPDTNSMAQVDTTADDFTTNNKVYEKQISLIETGESIGTWNISIEGFEGLETGNEQVTHTAINTFKILPFQPSITLSKSVTVLYDPINGTINPKAIPSAELNYSITAKNNGRGYADDGSVVLQDEIPLDAELFIDNIACPNRGSGTGLGPVCFKDGASPNESGLTYDFVSLDDVTDHIQFSQDGSDFTYAPADTGDGYDDSVRFIRIAPIGNLNASDKSITFEPEFTFDYQIRLK